MYPFKKKKVEDSLSIGRLFPALKLRARKAVTLGFGIGESIVTAIVTAFSSMTYIGAGIVIPTILVKAVLYVGLSLGLSALSQSLAKKPSTSSVQNNGRVFNTKSVSAPVRVVYGQCKIGGNWFWRLP